MSSGLGLIPARRLQEEPLGEVEALLQVVDVGPQRGQLGMEVVQLNRVVARTLFLAPQAFGDRVTDRAVDQPQEPPYADGRDRDQRGKVPESWWNQVGTP